MVGVAVAEVESAQRGASFDDLAGLFWLGPKKKGGTLSALKDLCQNLLWVRNGKRTSYLLQAREVLQEL